MQLKNEYLDILKLNKKRLEKQALKMVGVIGLEPATFTMST